MTDKELNWLNYAVREVEIWRGHKPVEASISTALKRVSAAISQLNTEDKKLEARIEELEAKIFHMSEQGAKNDPLTWRRPRR